MWILIASRLFGQPNNPLFSLAELKQQIEAANGQEKIDLMMQVLTRFDFSADYRQQVAEELIDSFGVDGDPLYLGKAYCGLGTSQMHRGDLDGALKNLEKAEYYGLQCKDRDPAVFFKARCNRAAGLTARGESTVASTLLIEVIDFSKPFEDTLDVSFAYTLLAHHAESVGAVDLAYKYLQQAFDLATRAKKADMASQAGATILGIMVLNQQFEDARVWIEKVEPWVKQAVDPTISIVFEMHKADVQCGLGDPEGASRALEELLEHAKATNNPQTIGNVYLSLAASKKLINQIEEAIENLAQAQIYLASYARSFQLAKLHQLEAMHVLERHQEALTGLQQLANDAQDSYVRTRVYELLSHVYHAIGKPDLAFEALSKCREEERQRLTERAREQAAFMIALFDDQQRSSQLAVANEQRLAAEARAELSNELATRQSESASHDRRVRNYTIALSALALLVGLVFFRTVAKRQAALSKANHEHQLNIQLNEALADQAARLENEIAVRRQLELAVERKHRDETIGKLTGGVAHDFNNLLTVIMQSIELSKMLGTNLSNEVHQLLDASMKAAESGAGIVSQLLAYARQQPLAQRPINVATWLESSKAMLRQIAGKGLIIDANAEATASTICVDSARLTTAIINLLANARDAIDPHRGTIAMHLQKLTITDNEPIWSDVPHGDYLLFAIVDNGKGMSPEMLARACEPFFSTKAQTAGTGLGLSSALGFAKQSGGDLKLVSEVGKGTTASMLVPIIAPTGPTPALDVANPSSDTSHRILLVEDQADVRFVLHLSLKSMGLDVIEAANADEATRILQSENRPRWVLSDVRMPGSMNGLQLRDWILERYSDVKVILMSGYSETETEIAPGVTFIQKPVKPMELRKLLGLASS